MSESAVARSKVAHDKPAINQLIRQTLQALLLKATRLIQLFRREPAVQNSVGLPRQYEKPAMRKVTVEQARLLALGHANMGDEADSEFMKLLFSDERSPE